MKKYYVTLLAAGCLWSSVQANILLNPGFESGELGPFDGSGTVQDWILWGSSGWHHSDAGYKFDDKGIKIWWDVTGMYQDFDAVAGMEYTVGISAITGNAEPLKGWDGVLKLEWTDALWQNVGGNEIGRFYGAKDNKGIAGDEVNAWKVISGSGVAPINAVHGRLVFYLQQADNWESTTGGSLYWDNAFVIPEPITAGLLALGCLLALHKKEQKNKRRVL